LPTVIQDQIGNDAASPELAGSKMASSELSSQGVAEQITLNGPPPRQAWLQSTTAMALSDKAVGKLEQAKIEYHSKAWLSAEQSAWEAIAFFSQAIDLRTVDTGAMERFRVAREAIIEARDFGATNATTQSDALMRIAKSHRTDVIADDEASNLTAAVAADRYLDFARRNLAPLAAADVRCAEAIDFLAAIYLARREPRQLPGETSLCLRRAALQGQPGNADLAARLGMQLADVGLVDEAKWAMQHSLQFHFQPVVANRLAALTQHSESTNQAGSFASIEIKKESSLLASDQRAEMPLITQLTPDEFAAVSKPVMQPTQSLKASSQGSIEPRRSSTVAAVSFASARLGSSDPTLHTKTTVSEPSQETEKETKQPNSIRRWFQSIPTPWSSTSK
jgi:hypothetical protein